MKFSENRTTTSEGRNGSYKCTGVACYLNQYRSDGAQLTMHGLTSRDMEARGDITLPIQDLPALIAELQRHQQDAIASGLLTDVASIV